MMQATRQGVLTRPHDLDPFSKFGCLTKEVMTRLYGRGNTFYAKANNLRLELTRQYDVMLQQVDVLVMPTLPYVATKIPPAQCSFYGERTCYFSIGCNQSHVMFLIGCVLLVTCCVSHWLCPVTCCVFHWL